MTLCLIKYMRLTFINFLLFLSPADIQRFLIALAILLQLRFRSQRQFCTKEQDTLIEQSGTLTYSTTVDQIITYLNFYAFKLLYSR